MDHLGICADGEIDETTKPFFGLFRDCQTERMQRERIFLVVEYSCCNGRAFNISVRMRIPGVDIPAHADPRRLENLVEGRNRGGFGLGENRGWSREQRRDGRSKNKF